MSFNFKRINLTIIDQLRSICKVSTDQWTDKDNLTVDMIIGAISIARGYSTDSEELADVKFQRDQFERLAKEWMDAFDTLKVKTHGTYGPLDEIKSGEILKAARDFDDTYGEKWGQCNGRAFNSGAWWAIDTMKGIK